MKKLLSKFRSNEDGVSAVEAAMLLPVFIPALLGTFELVFALYTSSAVERSFQEAVYELRIGTAEDKASAAGKTAEGYLTDKVCDGLDFVGCESKLSMQFAIYSDEGVLESTTGAQFIQPSKLVKASVTYDLSILGLLEGIMGTDMSTTSTLIFYTEPF